MERTRGVCIRRQDHLQQDDILLAQMVNQPSNKCGAVDGAGLSRRREGEYARGQKIDELPQERHFVKQGDEQVIPHDGVSVFAVLPH